MEKAHSPTALRCPQCDALVAPSDVFCAACGARTAAAVPRSDRRREVRSAVIALCVVAGYLSASGVVGYFVAKEQVKVSLASSRQLRDSEQAFLKSGEAVNIGEWRAKLVGEPLRVVGVHVLLLTLVGALCVWARSSPFAALCVGAAIYVSVVVTTVALEPSQWYLGLLLRIVVAATLLEAMVRTRSTIRYRVRTAQ